MTDKVAPAVVAHREGREHGGNTPMPGTKVTRVERVHSYTEADLLAPDGVGLPPVGGVVRFEIGPYSWIDGAAVRRAVQIAWGAERVEVVGRSGGADHLEREVREQLAHIYAAEAAMPDTDTVAPF